MKNNTTITTRILAEFRMKIQDVLETCGTHSLSEDTIIYVKDSLCGDLSKALSRQREEIVKQLRMEPDEACEECAMAMSHLMASVCGHHKTAAKNKLIIEFNRKLEELNV